MSVAKDTPVAGQPSAYDRYVDLIRGIELQDVWLAESDVTNHVGPTINPEYDLQVMTRASYRQQTEDGRHELVAFQDFKLVYSDEARELATVRVLFALSYQVPFPVTDDLWNVFKEQNLPVNAWPFLREYVSTTLGRMGWTPLTLPAIKIGVDWNDSEDEVSEQDGT
ncbi:MAG TPA: hypothetical protein VGT61_01715 [Thermomicrobiales bacterium]|jgi:hypothetical protein|nr:hypothetical protein [Thermomicrobiales bacterium]